MPTVLTVDDEPGMLLVLSRILESAGYTVYTAESGHGGLDMAKRVRPDAVLLDIRLPDMDGPTLLKEIRTIYPEIPIVMCSGFGDIETAVQSVKQGATDYISKPFKNEEVLRVVKKILAERVKVKIEPEKVAIKEVVKPVYRPKPALNLKVVLPISLGLILLIGIGGLIILKVVPKKSIPVSSFSVPYSHPTALAFDGTNLWVSSWFTQTVYKHKLEASFPILGSYYFSALHLTGLAWGNNCVWSCDPWTRKIYRHNLDDTLSVTATYNSPSVNPTGLFWDGANLWSCDATAKKIYKHKVDEQLSVTATYDSPGPNPVGIFSDGKNFWSADGENNKIYKHKLDEKLTVETFCTPEVHQHDKLTGMTGGSGYIWTVSESASKIFLHKIKSLKFTSITQS